MKSNIYITLRLITLLAFVFLGTSFTSSDFLEHQKETYPRVQNAFDEKGTIVSGALSTHELKTDNVNILMIVHKNEKKLTIYAKYPHIDSTYKKITDYNICFVGEGYGFREKGKKGLTQLPEGFYHIKNFNAVGSSHLSLGVSYPNKLDLVNSKNLSSDVFIKGSCETNTPLSMSENDMKEIYLYAVHAYNSGQKQIPIYIFPYEMTKEKHKQFKELHKKDEHLTDFHDNLKLGFDKFDRTHRELFWTVSTKGRYTFR